MNTPMRSIRVDADLWQSAQRVAKRRRETLSAVLVRALVDYVKDDLTGSDPVGE